VIDSKGATAAILHFQKTTIATGVILLVSMARLTSKMINAQACLVFLTQENAL